jgi:type III pantothenate kinase
MLLTYDVGNTNIVVGLFDGAQLVGHWRLTTSRHQTGDELRLVTASLLEEAGVAAVRVEGVAVACVVPSVQAALRTGLEPLFGRPPRFLTARTSPIVLDVAEPHAVGADRIANCIAARARCPDGEPVVVIDVGTALTFDLVSGEGAFLGGAIAPSMRLAAGALVERAAQLFAVDLSVPASVVGTTTADNLRAGIVLGYLDLVAGLIARFRAEIPDPVHVIATGGHGALFAERIDAIEAYAPFLTLEGLRSWWEATARAEG